jgi:uracil-DNA glycosylase
MNLFEQLPKEWSKFLELEPNYFEGIERAITGKTINPPVNLIFKAFEIPPNRVKVVILGQDPYPNPQDAMGLAFSISPDREKIPGSLRNIKKELERDLDIELSDSGDLTPWSEQGVMLLNRILTTQSGESLAHKEIGWQKFTNLVIEKLSTQKVIFIFWGKSAEIAGQNIREDRKIVGIHPSPLSASRGFFGSKPFSRCNKLLKEIGQLEINWQI